MFLMQFAHHHVGHQRSAVGRQLQLLPEQRLICRAILHHWQPADVD